jgi:hemerythrin
MKASVDALPAQQQNVFKATMSIVAALRSEASTSIIQSLLAALREQLEAVFDVEEATMTACELPDAEPHLLAHGWLRTVLLELCTSARQLADTPEARGSFAGRFQREFSAPLISHAQTLDRKMSVLLGKVRAY